MEGLWSAQAPRLTLGCDTCGRPYPAAICLPSSSFPGQQGYVAPQPGHANLSAEYTFRYAGTHRISTFISTHCMQWWRGYAVGPDITIEVSGEASPAPSRRSPASTDPTNTPDATDP